MDPGMGIHVMPRRATADDLETMPAIEPDVALGHLGRHKRQAPETARPRDFLDPLRRIEHDHRLLDDVRRLEAEDAADRVGDLLVRQPSRLRAERIHAAMREDRRPPPA